MPSVDSLQTPSICTSANVQIINDLSSFIRDNVSISMDLFIRLFPHSQNDNSSIAEGANDNSYFVLIKFIGVPDYFPKFNIYQISQINDSTTRSSGVYITNHANFPRFGSNLTFGGCVIQSIDRDSIPALDQVFIHIPGAIYDILNQFPESIIREKFSKEYISRNFLSQGDIIRSLNGYVSLCEPFYQGIVESNTKLVFVRVSLNEALNGEYAELFPYEYDSTDINIEDFDLDLSEYLSKGIIFDDEETKPSKPIHELSVSHLPHRISTAQVDSAAEDPELYAFVTTQDLLKLGFPVFSGDIVDLAAGEDRLTIKLFTILEPHNTFKPGTIYLSPLLLVNLHLPANAKVVIHPHSAPVETLSAAIPIAIQATISRVVSPITMDKAYQRSYFAEMKTTFHSQSKCFKLGDMFPVCIDSVLSRAYFELNALSDQNDAEDEDQESEIVPTGNPNSVAWFKVIDISGENSDTSATGQFRIDPSKTALTSSGVEFVGVPPNKFSHWSEYLGMPPLFNYHKAFSDNPRTFKYASDFYRILETGIRLSTRASLRTSVLLHSISRGLGKTTLVRSTALDLGFNLIEIDAIEIFRPGAELKTIGLLSGKIEKQFAGQTEAATCDIKHILYVKHIEFICAQVDPNDQGAPITTSLSLKVIQTLQEILVKYPNVVLVASSNDADKVSDSFRQMITFELAVTVPSEAERSAIFDFLLETETRLSNSEEFPDVSEDIVEFVRQPEFDSFQVDKRRDIRIQTLALQSAGLTPVDLKSIMRKAKQSATHRLIDYSTEHMLGVEKLIKVGNGGSLLLIPEDFEKAINDARNQFSDSIGAPRIPNVKWEDIGGLDMVKEDILDTIDLPMKHPELFSNGLKKRSGILFYGPPGTGKTLLAKAIATNFSLNFFSVKGPELLNMYIGESEANVRRVFQRARDAKPCVIFFDELDSVAPKRGNQGDSGGVMDRIVSQLLAELDGMSGGESDGDGVFVVGATNRPDLLDEALLRPGRFDKMLYLGISDTNEKQTKILEALTRKFQLSDDVDLAQIAENCSFTLTGADFYALCSDSMLNAMTRAAGDVDEKLKDYNRKRKEHGQDEVSSRWWFDHEATPSDINVVVSKADFQKAQSELAPSVSAEELEHYLRVKENFEGGKKKANSSDNDENKTEYANLDENGYARGHASVSGFHDGDTIVLGDA